MNSNDKPQLPAALVQVKDVLGVSEPAKALVEAIVRGVGEWAYPWVQRRKSRADIQRFQEWCRALREEGLPAQGAEMSLEERTVVRVVAQETRHQRNREAIAVHAIEELKQISAEQASKPILDTEHSWLDMFWKFAENVSDVDFQSIWGRVLTRQVSGGVKYSARCLAVLSTTSRQEAQLLEGIARLHIQIDRPPLNPLHVIMTQLSPQKYSPPFSIDYPLIAPLNRRLASCFPAAHSEILGPIGIYVEGGWGYDVHLPIVNGETTFLLAGRRFRVTGFPSPLPQGSTYCSSEHVILGGGTQISPVGAEILSLIHAEPNPVYVTALAAGLAVLGLELRPT
jgi:hypothetical protein